MAQDQANRVTRRLAHRYRHDAVLQHLPAPNAVVDEVEVTLHFAVESVDDEDEEGLNPSEVHEFTPNRVHIARLARHIASLVADGLAEEIKEAGETIPPGGEALLSSLAQASTREALAVHVGAALRHAWSGPEWPSPEGAIDEHIESGLNEVARRLSEVLQADESLKTITGDVDRTIKAALQRKKPQLLTDLKKALVRFIKATGKLSDWAAIRVILDSATLSHLPEHAVQTMKIKLDLRGYRSVPESESIHIIPEDR